MSPDEEGRYGTRRHAPELSDLRQANVAALPEGPPMNAAASKTEVGIDFFRSRSCVDESGCWVWKLQIDRSGYGRAWVEGKYVLAHRAAYRLLVGSLEPSMDVDHTCWNRSCCNPAHLRLLPPALNRRLQRSATKTHCVHGHLYSPENTYRRNNGTGTRECRECNRRAVREYKRKIRNALTTMEAKP